MNKFFMILDLDMSHLKQNFVENHIICMMSIHLFLLPAVIRYKSSAKNIIQHWMSGKNITCIESETAYMVQPCHPPRKTVGDDAIYTERVTAPAHSISTHPTCRAAFIAVSLRPLYIPAPPLGASELPDSSPLGTIC